MVSRLLRKEVGQHLPVVVRAEGVYVWDSVGRKYLDASSGAAVMAIGHGDRKVLEAMAEQARRVTFAHHSAFTSEPAESLAQYLTELTGMDAVWLVNSGSEAVEAAMQFALQYWREIGEEHRTQFLSHRHGYHGTTLGALSLSGHARRANSEALLHTFHGLQAPWPFRYGKGRKEAEYTKDLLAHAEKVICSAGNRLAAIVIEPIGGATGGVVLPPAGYLTGLQRLCQANGALLVLDEVMTGLWRTGTPLAGAHWDLRPDIVTLGKGLGAGYTPIAATLLASRVTDAIRSGSGRVLQGHTYAGNPLGSAVALAVLQRLDELRIPDRIPVTGRHLLTELERLAQSHRLIAEVRGLGLLAGLELADSADAPAVVGALTGLLVEAAAGEGLLVYPASGGINDAILVAPPLTVSDEQVDEIATKLDRALSLVEMHLESVRGLPRLACSLR